MKIKVKDLKHFNALIIRKGYNKSEFSRALKLSQPFTVQLTNGYRNPSPKVAKKITDILEVDFDEIFTIEEDEVFRNVQ